MRRYTGNSRCLGRACSGGLPPGAFACAFDLCKQTVCPNRFSRNSARSAPPRRRSGPHRREACARVAPAQPVMLFGGLTEPGRPDARQCPLQPSDTRWRLPQLMLVVNATTIDRGALSRLLCLAYRRKRIVDVSADRSGLRPFKVCRRLIGAPRIARSPRSQPRPSCRRPTAPSSTLACRSLEWRPASL